MAKTIRVRKDGNVWIAKKDGSSRASAIRNTQREAYLAAREIALNQGLTITVHAPNGQIQKVVHPKENLNEDDCFITTACVRYYNLPDNCYQLQKLRSFRDNYLKNQKDGNDLIQQYYSVAPTLVKLLNEQTNKGNLFREIFHQINTACALIEIKENAKAKNIYIQVVSNLLKYFQLS
ncbi:MAG: DUF2188 domain-containing protein [Chitinophagaceae bacterium]|nr:DUF2188 domain-containing protein [Chitinophagaceae bacterium]